MALVAIYKNPGDYFVAENGDRYKWEILEEGGSFVSTLTAAGRDFISTRWEWSDKDEYSPFIVSESQLSVYDDSSGNLYSDLSALLSSNQEDKYILRITLVRKEGAGSDVNQVKWQGYIKRGQLSKDEDGNNVVTVSAFDGIDMLSRKKFVSTLSTVYGDLEAPYVGRYTYTSTVAEILNKIGLDNNFYVTCFSYPRLFGAALTANGGVQLEATDNPWDNVYLDRERYTEGMGVEFKPPAAIFQILDGESKRPVLCSMVLEDILITWGCTMFQWEGDWHIIQVNKRAGGMGLATGNTIRRWKYDMTGSGVGTPNYSDTDDYVISPSTELIERTPGTISALKAHDAVNVGFGHGEYKFMPNPGFDITSSGAYSYEPIGWQLSGYAGARYENNGNGDGQFIADAIPVFGSTPTPTTPTGTGSGSVDAFVRSQAESGTAASDDNAKIIATVDPGPVSGTLSQINISAYDGNYIAATESLWVKNNSGNYVELELTAALKPGDERVFFTSVNIGSGVSYIYGKNSGYAYSASETNIDQDEYLNFSAQFLPTLKGDTASIPTNSYAQLKAAYYQIKLSNGSSTYYLKQSTGFYQWTTDVYWLTRSVAENDWNNIEFTIWDKTPISGEVTVTIGPAIDTRQVSISTENNVASFDELRWDNVDIRPMLNPLNPNAESTGTIVFDEAQTTEVVSVREVPVRIGDAPYNPCRFGMSLDSDGLLQTANWSEDPIGSDAESELSHEGLLGTAVLRSLRAPRETHSATYFGLSETLGCWHVISRGGSEYAPKSITTQWNRSNASGTWYKVTESGFTSDTAIIKGSAAFVSSRGGVGESSARFFQNIGNALFADGSTAITRTSSPISAGTVTSISVESIAEPIFKTGDLISIMGPDLSFVQARISADQDALATTLSIEDKDSPGTGVTFAEEMPSPAAVYFLEQELLTLARLGEQGFAVTVLGENLGTINETKSGSYTTLAVSNWGISVAADTDIYITQSDGTLQVVTLASAAPKGSTSISFYAQGGEVGDAITIDVTTGDKVKPSGTVNRADFQVTADAITSYLGNPGDVIATVTGSSFDGTNTSVTVSGLGVTVEAGESILFYTQGGTVIKAIVNATTSSSPIVLTSASGDQTGNITSGDKVVPGSVTGLRIDMDGIEVRADEIRSSNYSAGSAGWLIEADGDAFFNDISARGSIVITGTSSGITNFSDAGAGATADTLDDLPDGSTYARPLASGLSSGQVLLSQAAGSLDNIADGSTYAKVLSTSISAGQILLSEASGDLDDIADGTYGKVLATSISAGKILLAETTGDLDDIADGTYGKVLSTEISAGHIKILGADGTTTVIDGGQIQSASIKTGDIAADSITADKIDVTNLQAISADLGSITAGSLNIGSGTFVVTSGGALTATSATITGAITATSGSITGALSMGTSGIINFAGGGSLSPRSLQSGTGTLSLGGQSVNIGSGLIVADEDNGSVAIAGTSTGAVSIGATSANLSLTTTTSGNISLTSAGNISLSATGSITAGGNGIVTEGGAVSTPSTITSDTIITLYIDGTAYEINAEAV